VLDDVLEDAASALPAPFTSVSLVRFILGVLGGCALLLAFLYLVFR